MITGLEIVRVELVIAGVPQPQPRPRARALRTKRGNWIAQVYNPKSSDGWKSSVLGALLSRRPAQPWSGPVRISIDAYFNRPDRLMRRKDPDGPVLHVARPDTDNVAKSVLDALTAGGLWEDDAQVCQLTIRKFYAAKDCDPGVVIVAEHLVAAEVPA